MFASTPATSRRQRRHPHHHSRRNKTAQKSTKKILSFLGSPSPSQTTISPSFNRTNFEQSLVTKRPRRTRDRYCFVFFLIHIYIPTFLHHPHTHTHIHTQNDHSRCISIFRDFHVVAPTSIFTILSLSFFQSCPSRRMVSSPSKRIVVHFHSQSRCITNG